MEFKLKEVISREPTLLVMVVGVPNVGKSALINSIHQIASSRFPGKLLLFDSKDGIPSENEPQFGVKTQLPVIMILKSF